MKIVLYGALAVLVTVGLVVLYFWRPLKEAEPSIKVVNTVPATESISVFFGNRQRNPDQVDCSLVYPVSRKVPSTTRITSGMQALVAGPAAAEQTDGYLSPFSAATAGAVRSVRVGDNTAFVDFDDLRTLVPNASASCASAGLMAEIETTLKQLTGAENVVAALAGSSQDFYEWLQLSCPAASNNCDPAQFSNAVINP